MSRVLNSRVMSAKPRAGQVDRLSLTAEFQGTEEEEMFEALSLREREMTLMDSQARGNDK